MKRVSIELAKNINKAGFPQNCGRYYMPDGRF